MHLAPPPAEEIRQIQGDMALKDEGAKVEVYVRRNNSKDSAWHSAYKMQNLKGPASIKVACCSDLATRNPAFTVLCKFVRKPTHTAPLVGASGNLVAFCDAWKEPGE